MSKKTKIALASAVLAAGVASVASAHDRAPTVTLGGSIDTQFGYQSQKSGFNTAGSTTNQRSKHGLVNDTKVHVKADAHKGGLKYGGKIVLNTDTSNSKVGESSVANQTMMFVESSFGRMEAGSYTGAYDALHVGARRLASATGGIDGDWSYWVNTDVDLAATASNTVLPVNPGLPTEFDRSHKQNASKLTYFTPTFAGFKAGVTWTPDTEQHGTVNNLVGLSKDFTSTNTIDQVTGYKNVFQGGFNYHHKFDKVTWKFSALGEAGKAKKVVNTNTYSRHDLRAWELGASAHYMGFGLGGAYGDWGKSGLLKTRNAAGVISSYQGAKAGKYWNVAANYEHNHFSASLGYMAAETGGFGLSGTTYDTRKGKSDVVSFGVDYKLAPGFMPYAEVTHFKLQNKTVVAPTAGKNSGTVFLAGSKLHF
ncbi:MAG: porin [Alphaproteobacteria bacterium]|jgi:outer membrane protein OmpU|nr:porin [Candidatus Jidaibacter sp.]